MFGDFMERLQKVIANSGYCSRRKAEEYINMGKVKVNGEIIRELGTKVSGDDYIEVNGNPLNKKEEKVYYLLNKPRGVVTTAKDDKNRKRCPHVLFSSLLTSIFHMLYER